MFKNAGAKWDREPELVKDHDFRSEADGGGISISDAEMKALTIVRDDELPAWNDTLSPG